MLAQVRGLILNVSFDAPLWNVTGTTEFRGEILRERCSRRDAIEVELWLGSVASENLNSPMESTFHVASFIFTYPTELLVAKKSS